MGVESQAERLSMLADWDVASIGTASFPCTYDEPFADDLGALGQAPTFDTDRQTWLDAGGALDVTVSVVSGTAGDRGSFVAREVRVVEDGAMVRVRLERVT